MAKVYTAPIPPPQLEPIKTYVQRVEEYAELVGKWCESRVTTNQDRARGVTDPLAGEVIVYPMGDGQAVYVVMKSRPLMLVWLDVWDSYRQPAPFERGLNLSDVRTVVERNRRERKRQQAVAEWWDAQEIGSILHYHNGFGEYVRCVVVKFKEQPV